MTWADAFENEKAHAREEVAALFEPLAPICRTLVALSSRKSIHSDVTRLPEAEIGVPL